MQPELTRKPASVPPMPAQKTGEGKALLERENTEEQEHETQTLHSVAQTLAHQPQNDTLNKPLQKITHLATFPQALPLTTPVTAPPQLTLNIPGDEYEQEADKMAEQVVRMHQVVPPAAPGTGEDAEESENNGKNLPGKVMLAPLPVSTIQRKTNTLGAVSVSPQLTAQIHASRGAGSPLPEPTRRLMEGAFGAEFSQVRIHTDAQAAAMSKSIQARAFTYGRDIYFGEGAFDPKSIHGKRLLAHELTHVLQQARLHIPGLIQREMVRDRDGNLFYDNEAGARRRLDSMIRIVLDPDRQGNYFIEWRWDPTNPDTDVWNRGTIPRSLEESKRRRDQLMRIEHGNGRWYISKDTELRQIPQQTPTQPAQAPPQPAQTPPQPAQAPPQQIPQQPQQAPPQVQQTPQIPQPQQTTVNQAQIQLTGSVGVDGNNIPVDVLAVQQRLLQMGYLNQADFNVEQANVTPPSPGQVAAPIDVATIPQTMKAIADFTTAAAGRPILLIRPGQEVLRMLNASMIVLGTVNITQAVGREAPNTRSDVQAVQDRLLAIGLLSPAHHTAETVTTLPPATLNITDASIPQTIAAINTLNFEFVGITNWAIRPNSPEEAFLNNPPRFRQQIIRLSGGVGVGLNNASADVRIIQDRLLVLGYLSQTHHAAEQVIANPPTVVDVARIPQTLAALRAFQQTVGLTRNLGEVRPGSETLRLLTRPNLPVARNIVLGNSVGDGGRNMSDDVRNIQDRLHELGFLDTLSYIGERSNPNPRVAVATARITATIAAIRTFQSTVVGVNDGLISAGGKTLRTLNDPTYGTATSFNREAANQQFGIGFNLNQLTPLSRVIRAIEQHEANGRTGEAPADLVNSSGVPASFGSAQMIAGTALMELRRAGNQALRDHYGLTTNGLTQMDNRATRTQAFYVQIFGLIPAGGESEAQLMVRIAAFIQQHGQQFRTDTGLMDEDITRMFRFAQLRRRILAATSHLPNSTTAPPDVNAVVTALLANLDFNASFTALQLDQGSLRAYVRNRDNMGENPAGFITKAVFSHPEGQRVRNAMTDANGRSIGRMSITGLFNTATSLVAATETNRDRKIAARTARAHNSGAGNIGQPIATILANPYVIHVLAIWDQLPAPPAPQQQLPPAGGNPAGP